MKNCLTQFGIKIIVLLSILFLIPSNANSENCPLPASVKAIMPGSIQLENASSGQVAYANVISFKSRGDKQGDAAYYVLFRLVDPEMPSIGRATQEKMRQEYQQIVNKIREDCKHSKSNPNSPELVQGSCWIGTIKFNLLPAPETKNDKYPHYEGEFYGFDGNVSFHIKVGNAASKDEVLEFAKKAAALSQGLYIELVVNRRR